MSKPLSRAKRVVIGILPSIYSASPAGVPFNEFGAGLIQADGI
jgi:hypothetical protein